MKDFLVAPDRFVPHAYRFWLALGLVGLASGLLVFQNLDFPLGFHADEAVKVAFAAGADHNYFHPPLLIVLARFFSWVSSAADRQDVLIAGRLVSALSGIGASVAFYLVLRRFADDINALLWSCAFAMSPAIAVHAHYFKEDSVFIFSLCLGLHALVRLKERQSLANLVYLGVGLGLAMSAKYVGVINSAVLFVVAIVYCRLRLRQSLAIGGLAVVTVAVVFALSLMSEPSGHVATVVSGFLAEWRHAAQGHDLREWFSQGYGLTHFRYNLLPSVTVPTMLVALATIAYAVAHLRDYRVAAFAAAAAAWLFFLELSPLKLVGLIRYVLPVFVYLLLAAGVACSALAERRSRLTAISLSVVAMLASAQAGVAYVGNLSADGDTRSSAMKFLKDRQATNFVVDFPMGQPAPPAGKYRDLQDKDFLVSVKFARFLRGGELKEQNPEVYVLAGMFRCLEGHIAAQFSRIDGDYAYVAPTVKIYDLRGGRGCIPKF